ncbi:hypothetical protein [Nitrolancea hollandica]|uniref:Uncharacterized protein n=1 Tax=Nitrolancea hollandica Lb TaxID=1129897 RepID=I4EMJ8_9BACT|nr:hypothetical protein [Nitrolancea hollandica]CCF85911.1 hypothetical protein NITHO_6130002 [Nitrolancea hollandica Lb]
MSATDVLDTLIPSEIDRVARTTNPGWERLLMAGDRLSREADARITALWNDDSRDKSWVIAQADSIRSEVREQVEAAFSQLESEIVTEQSRQRAKVTQALSGGGDATAQLLFEQRVQNARPIVMRKLSRVTDGEQLRAYYQDLLDSGDFPAAAVLERETDSFFEHERANDNLNLHAFHQARQAAITARLPVSAQWALEALGEFEQCWLRALRGYRPLYKMRVDDIGAVVTRANDPNFSRVFFEPAERFPLSHYGI